MNETTLFWGNQVNPYHTLWDFFWLATTGKTYGVLEEFLFVHGPFDSSTRSAS